MVDPPLFPLFWFVLIDVGMETNPNDPRTMPIMGRQTWTRLAYRIDSRAVFLSNCVQEDAAWLRLPLIPTKFVRKLEEAGFDAKQAEAVSDALNEALNESTSLILATKQDIARVETKLIEHDGDFKFIKWMLGILLGDVIALILKPFFPS